MNRSFANQSEVKITSDGRLYITVPSEDHFVRPTDFNQSFATSAGVFCSMSTR